MKNCPRCGAKLEPNSKFCPQCGLDLTKAENEQAKPQRRPSKIRKICLTIAAYVVAIAAAIALFFVLQSSLAGHTPLNNNPKRQDPIAQYLHKTKITPKEMMALALVYAHKKSKNDNWNAAYDQAQEGKLDIATYHEYSFGNYSFKAPTDGAIYLTSPQTGCIISNIKEPLDSKVTFINSDTGPEKSISLKKLVTEVLNLSSKNDLNKLNKGVALGSGSSNSEAQNNSEDKLSWNDEKEQKLAEFMSEFCKNMKQKYQEYTGDKELKTLSGEEYPSVFHQFTFRLYSDSSKDTQRIDIQWDPRLKTDAEYKVVSIFNCNVGAPEAHITYLFCVNDNQPIVLVDQTTNGDDIRVKPTANTDVSGAFANIITGKEANYHPDND